MPSEATLALGGAVARALLGVDALYRLESGDETGLVVLNMDWEGRYPLEAFAGYGEASARFLELRKEAALVPEADRRAYYDRLCHSTLAFVTWRTEGLAFPGQLEDFLHGPARPASDAELDALRSGLRALLTGMGYGGDLAAQAAAWEERNRVPAEAVPEVLTDLLDEAWARTEEALGGMPAPKSDGMGVRPVSGVPYNARCDYAARTIDINVDPTLTRPGLKHLAVHEGYPGHWLQFKLRETMATDGRAAPDVLLSVVNTASSSVFEGIADHGLRTVDWIEGDDDRVQGLLTAYRAGIGTGAAWRLHGLGWEVERATDWLRAHALTGGEGWVRNRMRFVAAPSRAVLIWSYWWGEPSVAAAFDRVAPGDRPAFLDFLYGRMHSTDTVALFDGARSEGGVVA